MCVRGSVLARVSRGPRTKFSPMSARLRGVLRFGEARFGRLFAGSSAPGCSSVLEGGPGGASSRPEAAGGSAGGSARISVGGLPSRAAIGSDDDAVAPNVTEPAGAFEAAGGGTFGNRSSGEGGGCIGCSSLAAISARRQRGHFQRMDVGFGASRFFRSENKQQA